MLTRSRAGFTLAEVMIALALTMVVAGTLYRLLVTTQRTTRAQAQRVELQSNLRAGSLIVLSELRELSAGPGASGAQNDILVAGSSALVYRAMRGIGFICGTPSATTIRIARGSFTGPRDPQAGGDEALVFIEDRAAAGAEDIWLGMKIVSVATSASCPGALGPGITLTLPASPVVAGLEAGTPVRITEVMELRLYESEGRSWLGARSVSSGEPIQPLVGPLTTGSGFRLEYLDAAGNPTGDRPSIKSIRVALRGTTQGGTGNGPPVEEELLAQVALRNAISP
ncbi:MAG TPA: prepilin-type N-terminal cleavage/methylation domain-containing protein [Gemmatimonadales bacterium]